MKIAAYLLLFIPLIFFAQKKAPLYFEKEFNKAYNYMPKDDYYAALKLIDSVLNVIKPDNKLEKGKFYTLKASVYENIYDFEKSNYYSLKALQNFDSIGETYYYNWTNCFLAGNYMFHKDYKSFYDLLPILKEDLKEDFLLFYVYQIELQAFYEQKKYKELLQIVDKYLLELENTKFTKEEFQKETYNYKSIYNILKAFSLVEVKKYKQADSLLNKIKSIDFKKMFWLDEDLLKLEPEIYRYKYQLKTITNKNFDSLKHYHNLYVDKQQELFKFTKSRIKKNKMILKQQLEHEKDNIKKNALLKIEKQKLKSNVLLGTTILITLFTTLFTLYIFRNTKKMKIKSAKISELNKKLNEQNKELTTKHLINKELISMNERNIFTKTAQITTLRDKIKSIINDIDALLEDDTINHVKVGRIKNSLNTTITENDIWNEFKQQFDKIRPDFFKKLKEINIKLTTNDLKNCAYIITNLSVKEVASLTNLSPRTVETARYRLRKKLNIPSDVKLYDFLNSL